KEQQIIDYFKYGVRKVCAVPIWEFFLTAAGAAKPQRLAERFHLNGSIVSRGLSEGRLSLDTLIVMLTELRLEFRSLLDMPSIEARALGGYSEATRRLRSRDDG